MRDPVRLVILVSNARALSPTWSTIHLAEAALRRGLSVRVCEARDLEITPRGALVARAWCAEPPGMGLEELARALNQGGLPRRHVEFLDTDLLLVRVNPLRFGTLSLLMLARERGVRVVNDPIGLARSRSKAWLASIPSVPTPPTLVTRSRGAAQAFAERLGTPMVVKPAVGSGGLHVKVVPALRPELLSRALDLVGMRSEEAMVIQGYVEEASEGEKRLVWVDGQLLGAYLRRRPPEGLLHNLRQGGQPLATTIDAPDRRIAAAIGPHLLRNGIRIAGLDVMGGLLIEVNTLNPGGIHHAESLRTTPGIRIADHALELLLVATSPADEDVDR